MLIDPIADLRNFLICRPALLIHFSGVPKGIGHDFKYPEDLNSVIENPNEIFSCSTIEATDFDTQPVRASGYVGVVLNPIDEQSIIAVHYEDMGAPKTTEERRRLSRSTTVSDCASTFQRGDLFSYNEWLVGPSHVVGAFIAPSAQVHTQSGSFRYVGPSEIADALNISRVFSAIDGVFMELNEQGGWDPLDMSSVYR